MARIIVDELITLVSLKLSKDTQKVLQGFNSGLKSINNIALIATASLSGMAYAMDKIVGGVDKQARFAEGIGISYENLQRLQYAASKARISTDELDGALETLVQTMTSTKPGEYNSALFQLGVGARELDGSIKDPIKGLLEIGDALSRLSAIRRQQFGGSRLGYGSQFTNFLGQGSAQIRKDMEEAETVGAVLPERLKDLASGYFDNSMVRLKATLRGLAAIIALSLTPAVIKFLDNLDKWIIKNKELLGLKIGEVLKGIGQGISDFGNIFMVATRATTAFTNALVGNNKELGTTDEVANAVSGTLSVLAAAFVIARGPAILLGIAIVKILPKVTELFQVFSNLKQVMDILFPGVFDKAAGSIDKATNSLERFKAVLKDVNPFGGMDLFGGYTSGVKDVLGRLKDGSLQIDANAGFGLKPVDVNAGIPSGSSEVTNNVTINVNGAGDPLVVANIVKSKMDLSTTAQVATGGGFNRPKVT
jgi:hypothetical protein